MAEKKSGKSVVIAVDCGKHSEYAFDCKSLQYIDLLASFTQLFFAL